MPGVWVLSSSVKGCVVTRPRDIPYGPLPVAVVWHKRRWRCRERQVSPDGPDLIVDLVGGDTLRAVADLMPDRTRIISAADPDTTAELGGLPLARADEAMGKITDVIKYGLVDPHVEAQFSLDHADRAIAAVETGHAAGKIVVVP